MVVLNLFQIGHCVLNISLQWTTLLNAVFIFLQTTSYSQPLSRENISF